MKKKIIKFLYVILIIIAFKVLINIIINYNLIQKYNNEDYSETNSKILKIANFIEPYIANYNYGNILYQNGEYEKAIEEYKKALNGYVPQQKECKIRINYALAICKLVNVNEKNDDSIKEAIKKYESAIEILTEKGCANKNDNNGHSDDAETLKKDIQDEINRLTNLKNNKSDDSEGNDKKEGDEKEKTTEEKIKEIKEQATKEQREKESKMKNFYNTAPRDNMHKKVW